MNVWKDIKSGALPPEEIPGFIGWALRKLSWVFIILAVVGRVAWLLLS